MTMINGWMRFFGRWASLMIEMNSVLFGASPLPLVDLDYPPWLALRQLVIVRSLSSELTTSYCAPTLTSRLYCKATTTAMREILYKGDPQSLKMMKLRLLMVTIPWIL
jgi:hypothetical protein